MSVEYGGIVSVLKSPYKNRLENAVITRIQNSYENELNIDIRYKTTILSSNMHLKGFAVKTFKITANSIVESNALEM